MIMLDRLRPFANLARQRLGRARSPEEAALATEVLQPEEVEPHDPPLGLPGQLAKATAGLPGLPLDYELELATRTRLVHAPVLRHLVPDALVHPGGVDFRGGRLRLQRLDPRSLASTPVRSIPQALYCNTEVSHRYFGHWLLDACSTTLLQRDGEALILEDRPDWPDAADYLRAFGLRPEAPALARVDRLAMVQDFGQGSSKRDRYAELRRRLFAAFPGGPGGGRAVYFRRGDSGIARPVANEDEVAAALADRGFEVLDVRGARVADYVRRFQAADIVVSMDGSHLHHLYLTMPPGAKVVVLVPADRFTMTQVGYTAAVGLRLGYMVVDPTPGGYHVSLPDLHATLDLMGC